MTTDAGEDVGKGSLRYHWWECKLVPTAVEISMEVPQNSESGTPLGLDHNARSWVLSQRTQSRSDMAHAHLLQQYLQQSNHFVSLGISQQMNG